MRGFKTNKNELENILKVKKIDIGLIQETLLPPNHKLKIHGYSLISKERKMGGGGVLILVKNGLNFKKMNYDRITDNSNIEICGIELRDSSDVIKFMSIYIPPNTKIEELDYLNEIDICNSIIGGDFNANHPSWSIAKKK